MLKSKRLFVNIAIFGSFLLLPFMPWYIPFLGAVYASWKITYYEIILFGFIIDLSFESSHFFTIFSHPFPFPFTILAVAIFIILILLKKRLRFYA